MRHFLILALVAAGLTGCATVATGPRFSPLASPPGNQSRIYLLRDKVLYLAQGPGIANPQIAIDQHLIGGLENGGYLSAEVSPGAHTVSVGVGDAQTIRGLTLAPGGTAFVDVIDKSRMAGARAFSAGLTGGALGGIAQALQEQNEAAERREGPIWRVVLIPPEEGIAILQTLSLSQ